MPSQLVFSQGKGPDFSVGKFSKYTGNQKCARSGHCLGGFADLQDACSEFADLRDACSE